MKNFLTIIFATVLLLVTSITTFGAEKKATEKPLKKRDFATAPTLTLKQFIALSVQNNPIIQRIEKEHSAQKYSIKRLAAIKDLYLAIKSDYTYIDPLEMNGMNFGTEKYNFFNFSVGAKKKFPTLLGMSAALELKYTGYKYNMASPTATKNTGVSISLSVSIPLLANFLGKIDQNSLAEMKLNLKIVEKLRKETYESFLTELHRAYYNWVLLVKKVEIYRGIMQRALGLYGQMARKTRVGLANWAEVHLASQNHLRYKNLLLATNIQLEEQYLKILSYMQGKSIKKANTKIEYKWQPQLIRNGKKAKLVIKKVLNENLRLIQMARLQQELAKIALSSANSAKKPSLNVILSATKGTKGDSFSSAFSSSFQKDSFFGGIEFSMPFQNRDKKNKALSQKENFNKAKANYRNAQIQIDSSLKILTNSIIRFQKLLSLSETMVKTSRYRIGAVYRQFNLGRMALYHITDARDALANARINLLEQQIMLQRLVIEYQSLTDVLFNKHSNLFK